MNAMAKKRNPPTGAGGEDAGGEDTRPTKTVRLWMDVADLATFVATRRKISVAQLLDPLIREEMLRAAKFESDKLQKELTDRGR